MRMNEAQLYLFASQLRKAIDQMEISQEAVGQEAFLRMKEFPNAACSEVCTVAGIYLSEEIGVAPLAERTAQIEEGDRWFGIHHWLEHDDIIIDLTADQFSMVEEPVIVSRQSAFHKHYAHGKATITTTFGLEHASNWLIPFYQSAKEQLESDIEKP